MLDPERLPRRQRGIRVGVLCQANAASGSVCRLLLAVSIPALLYGPWPVAGRPRSTARVRDPVRPVLEEATGTFGDVDESAVWVFTIVWGSDACRDQQQQMAGAGHARACDGKDPNTMESVLTNVISGFGIPARVRGPITARGHVLCTAFEVGHSELPFVLVAVWRIMGRARRGPR